jgi:hypothetical protein
MNTDSHILFNKNLEQLRRLGARGGKARARNLRARRARQMPLPLLPRPMAPSETAAEAIAILDTNFPGYAAPKNEIHRTGARLPQADICGAHRNNNLRSDLPRSV